ncbi:MAG: sugar phosphate isomerase/epimerase [Oscillospiraceae bacterium]|nr:sugar phosphate isomerase/epimerase [Oscillospiraceae bacterium]
MIKSGLCSVTFRSKTPQEIIDLAAKGGLQSIEWASDAHVNAGDIATAKEVKAMTEAAGLEVSSYGSYYRLGTNDDIVPYLESATALGAKEIRIWGGGNPSAYFLPSARRYIVNEAKEISRKAAEYGIRISTECHAHTITDTPESLLMFMCEVNEPNFSTYWQALLHIPEEQQLRSLKAVYGSGKLTNLHVYHFDVFDTGRDQRLLSEAYDKWLERFSIFSGDNTTRYAMLEFVRGGTDESLLADAETLSKLIAEANSK